MRNCETLTRPHFGNVFPFFPFCSLIIVNVIFSIFSNLFLFCKIFSEFLPEILCEEPRERAFWETKFCGFLCEDKSRRRVSKAH